MLFTTFAKLHKAGACREGYTKLARSLGGVNEYGKDTLIPLDKIIESNDEEEEEDAYINADDLNADDLFN